jgi:FecR protein
MGPSDTARGSRGKAKTLLNSILKYIIYTRTATISMLRIRFALAIVVLCSGLFVKQSVAGPLTSAEVTKIINRVAVIEPAKGDRPAVVRDIIKDDLGLQTGGRSRSELLFQDNTLTRLGAETFFSFKTGTRDLTLERGSMLLQVPKGLGGAKIHTAAVTAAITGTTIMMEYKPGKYLKVLVLEGSLRLSRNGSFGDSAVLHPGKMVIMRPDAKQIPSPIDVDLAQVVRTSSLVNFPGSNILPSMPLIQAAIHAQARELAKGTLVPTNLIMGSGTNVLLASNYQLSKTIGSISGLTTNPVAPTATSNAVNNVLGSGPAVSVSSSAQLVSLLGNVSPGPGGTINVTAGAVNAGVNVTGTVSASTAVGSVTTSANVSSGGKGR